jgi:hypothetical protein
VRLAASCSAFSAARQTPWKRPFASALRLSQAGRAWLRRATSLMAARVLLPAGPSVRACQPLHAPRRTRLAPPSASHSASRRCVITASAAMAKPYGFIGLGIMGDAMARNLLKLGNGVVVYNRNAEKVRTLRVTNARRLRRAAVTRLRSWTRCGAARRQPALLCVCGCVR